MNGVWYDEFVPPVRYPLYQQDPCATNSFCFEYLNDDTFNKQVTFTISLPLSPIVVNANGFVLVSTSPFYTYEYTTTVPPADPNGIFKICFEYMINPTWHSISWTPGDPLATVTTDCVGESYIYYYFQLFGPNMKYIDLSGGSQTISQIITADPTFANACNGMTGTAPMVINGDLVIDADWCFQGVGGFTPDIIMHQGSSISINQGKTFLIENTHIYGCDHLWESIIVEPGAELEIQNSLIEDGYKSVSIDYNNTSNQSSILINKSTFNNNYISVFSPQGSNLVDSDVQLRIFDSEFTGTGTLKSHSDPQALTYPALGLSIWNIDDVLISGSAGSTMFSNLGTAIKASYSDIVMSGVYIKNMMNVPGPGAGQMGVNVFGVGSSLVNTYGGDSEFDGMHTGISNNLGTIDVSSITMRNLRTGIINFLGTVNDHRMQHNVIYASEKGIFNVGAKPIFGEIYNNKIFIDNVAQLPANTSGITASQSYTSSGRNTYYIHHNDINVDGTESGIYLNASERYTVNNNDIEHDNMGSNAYGIRANAGVSHKIGCNEILVPSGSYVSNTAAGIQAEQTGNPIISCNVVKDYSFGTRFNQTSAMTDFKGNYLDNTNDDGLYIDLGTSIGQQLYKGNSFPSQGSSILFEARNFNNTSLTIQASQFTVNSSIDPEYMPNWWTPVGPLSQWFVPSTGGTDFTCLEDTEGEDCPVFDIRHEAMRSEMMAMALGENWLEGEEGITQKYVMQRQLLHDLEVNEIQGDEPMAEWMAALEDTDAARMHSWNQEVNHILNASNEEFEQFETYRNAREAILSEIQEILLTCEENPAACIEATNTRRQELSTISRPIAAWQASKSTEQQTLFEALLVEIPDVESGAATLDLETSVYELQLHVHHDISILEEIKERLVEIASLCPNVYGPGVYKSRGLLMASGYEASWDDESCFTHPEERPVTPEAEASVVNSLQIFPTLTHDHVFVRIPQGFENLSVNMTNLQGIQVYVAEITSHGDFTIPMYALPPSMYVIEVRDLSGTVIKTQKVIKP